MYRRLAGRYRMSRACGGCGLICMNLPNHNVQQDASPEIETNTRAACSQAPVDYRCCSACGISERERERKQRKQVTDPAECAALTL